MVSQPKIFGEGAAGREGDVVPVGKDHLRVGMDLAVLQSRHAVADPPGQFADLRMQRAAEGDVHLLQAAADAENRNAARDAGLPTSASATSSRWMS